MAWEEIYEMPDPWKEMITIPEPSWRETLPLHSPELVSGIMSWAQAAVSFSSCFPSNSWDATISIHSWTGDTLMPSRKDTLGSDFAIYSYLLE